MKTATRSTESSLTVQKFSSEERATVFCMLPFTKKVIKIQALRYDLQRGGVQTVAFFKAFGHTCRVEVSLHLKNPAKVKNTWFRPSMIIAVTKNGATTQSHINFGSQDNFFTEAEAMQKALEITSAMIDR